MTLTLVQELDQLHSAYVVSINEAVGLDDHAQAEALAEAYEDEAIMLMAVREGRMDLLALLRRRPDSRLRRLVGRLGLIRAA